MVAIGPHGIRTIIIRMRRGGAGALFRGVVGSSLSGSRAYRKLCEFRAAISSVQVYCISRMGCAPGSIDNWTSSS